MTALLRATAGLILWAIAFSALYAVQGLACALGWDEKQIAGTSLARLVLLTIYAGGVGALARLSWTYRPRTARPELLDWLAFVSAASGLFAVIYTGLPIITTSICR